MFLFAQATLPPAPVIRQASKEIIARSDYDLSAGSKNPSGRLFLEILRWLIKPFEWLFESMEGMPDTLRWIVVIVAFVICIALIAHILYTLFSAIRGPISAHRRGPYTPAHEQLDPAELERRAESLASAGNYIEAVRLLFRAALRRIETAEDKRIRPGCTNRELLRRYRATPLFESLSRFVETIDLKWYGGAPCGEADYALCRGEHAKIRNYVQAPRTALGA